jgi:hypothetical protein
MIRWTNIWITWKDFVYDYDDNYETPLEDDLEDFDVEDEGFLLP